MKPERDYSIGLYRCPECKRGWLAYSEQSLGRCVNQNFDLILNIQAKNLNAAKSKAITMARAF